MANIQPIDSRPTSVDSTQGTEKEEVEPTTKKKDPSWHDKKAELGEESQATDSEDSALPSLPKGGQSARSHFDFDQISKEEISRN